jgi:hypothetical protein
LSKELYANAALHRFVRYDARREILASVGDIANIDLFGTQLLVAPYVRSGILLSPSLGIPESEILSREALFDLYDSGRGFMAQKFAAEDLFQGKVCLVLKIGHEVDAEDPRYGERPLRVGDWIFTLQENTRGVSICAPGAKQSRVLKALGIEYAAGWPSKFLYAADVYGRLDDPNILA